MSTVKPNSRQFTSAYPFYFNTSPHNFARSARVPAYEMIVSLRGIQAQTTSFEEFYRDEKDKELARDTYRHYLSKFRKMLFEDDTLRDVAHTYKTLIKLVETFFHFTGVELSIVRTAITNAYCDVIFNSKAYIEHDRRVLSVLNLRAESVYLQAKESERANRDRRNVEDILAMEYIGVAAAAELLRRIDQAGTANNRPKFERLPQTSKSQSSIERDPVVGPDSPKGGA